jgi:hypothetical protein
VNIYCGPHALALCVKPDHARRFIACAEACKSLATEDLEKHGLADVVMLQLLKADEQRAEMLAALLAARDGLEYTLEQENEHSGEAQQLRAYLEQVSSVIPEALG